MPVCPSCQREWPEGRETCGSCLATLVASLDATVTCPECGHVCPARMHTCPECLALLRPSEVDVTEDVARLLTRGLRMHRPTGRAPFAGGPACSLLRLHPTSPLVICGPDGLIEANVLGYDIAARPPLSCSTDGEVLFRIEPYGAAPDAVVAIGGDGAPLATFLRGGTLLAPHLEVRDETSAPAARLVTSPSDWLLVETGGALLATVDRVDVEDEQHVDDQWALLPVHDDPPLKKYALVALVVAAKVLLGRAEPVLTREPEVGRRGEPDGDLEDTLGAIGRSIVEDWLD